MRAAIFSSLFCVCSASNLAFADSTVSNGLTLWSKEPTRIFEAQELTLSEFQWHARPIVVFANTPDDPRVETQIELLLEDLEALIDRDLVVITDTDASIKTDLRTELRPRDFQIVLIGKDGTVKLRKPRPWNMRELARIIDKMPLRKQEMAQE